MVKDFWSEHPFGFCVASFVLVLGFALADKAAEIWELQTSTDPKMQVKAEEFRMRREEWCRKRELSRPNWHEEIHAKSSFAKAIIKPRLTFTIGAFILLIGVILESKNPIMYGLLAMLSFCGTWYCIDWLAWVKRNQKEIPFFSGKQRWLMEHPQTNIFLLVLMFQVFVFPKITLYSIYLNTINSGLLRENV